MDSESDRSWRALAVHVWRGSLVRDLWGQAAQLAFYFLFALFPFLLFLTTLLGLLAHTGSEAYENLLSYARSMLPYSVFDLVSNTLRQIQAGAGEGKLGFGVLATFWAASSGMSAMIDGLNRSFQVKDSRPWWKGRALALLFTSALSVFLVISIVLILWGSRLGEAVSGYFGLETFFLATWNALELPVALALQFTALALLYRFAPDLSNVERPPPVLPGALAGVTLWLAISLLFRLYLRFFNTYSAYGTIGAVMVLMMWFYLSSAAILLGAEINSAWAKAPLNRTNP